MTDLTNNLTPITDFLAKFPNPGLAFIEALAAGDICFSDEQANQSTLLFEELTAQQQGEGEGGVHQGGAHARSLFQCSRTRTR